MQLASAALIAANGALGLLLFMVARHTKGFAHSEAVQRTVSHSATLPCGLLVSFLIHDRLIGLQDTDPACREPGSDTNANVITITIFATLLVLTTLNNFFLASERKYLQLSGIFSMTTHSMIVLTYLQIHSGRSAGAILWPTWYGSVFWPARINLWLHSSMSQVLSFAASPRAVEVHGVQHILQRVADVYVMFVLGFLATAEPPGWVPDNARLFFTLAMLGGSVPHLLRTISFMHTALPLCLRVPDSSDATAYNRGCMRVLGHSIVLAWLTFPTIWLAAALGLITPGQVRRLAKPRRRPSHRPAVALHTAPPPPAALSHRAIHTTHTRTHTWMPAPVSCACAGVVRPLCQRRVRQAAVDTCPPVREDGE